MYLLNESLIWSVRGYDWRESKPSQRGTGADNKPGVPGSQGEAVIDAWAYVPLACAVSVTAKTALTMALDQSVGPSLCHG